MPLINCEINLILTWSARCFIIDAPVGGQDPTFKITEDYAKLLQRLKSGFKRTMNWNKYQSKVTVQVQKQYLDFLIDASFQGVNKLFVLSFENNGGRTSYTGYYLPLVEIKNYNVMINGGNFFDHPVKNYLIIYNNIRKIAIAQGDDYTTGCLLDYPYFKNCYNIVATYLSKQQALDADPKAIQQTNFTANLDLAGNTTMLLKKQKKPFQIFCESIVNLFYFNIISI